jgi:hypothetical protein
MQYLTLISWQTLSIHNIIITLVYCYIILA